MEGIHAYFAENDEDSDKSATHQWDHVLKASGRTSEGLKKLFREMSPFYPKFSALLAQPYENYEAQINQFKEEIQNAQNPIASWSFEAFVNCRPREFKVQVTEAMVRAAVQYRLHGENRLKSVLDPFTKDVNPARKIRAHLEACQACRKYLEDISQVAQLLSAADTKPDIQAANDFHQKWLGQLETEQSKTTEPTLAASLRRVLMCWRVVLPLMAAVAILITLILTSAKHSATAYSSQPGMRATAPSSLNPAQTQTLARYRAVAGQSR